MGLNGLSVPRYFVQDNGFWETVSRQPDHDPRIPDSRLFPPDIQRSFQPHPAAAPAGARADQLPRSDPGADRVSEAEPPEVSRSRLRPEVLETKSRSSTSDLKN